MKYRYYVLKVKVIIIFGERKKIIEKVKDMVNYNIEKGKKVCIFIV